MSFTITSIPLQRSGNNSTKWKSVYRALRENPGKAVFVAADGSTPLRVRACGYTSLYARITEGERLHTSTNAEGVYFWIEGGAK